VSSPAITFARVFEELTRAENPLPATIRSAFDAILEGAWTPVQVAGFAVALRMRGEDAQTVIAAAEAMRAVMVPVDHGLPAVMDTCGTGGDGLGTINVSTASALVVAACGAPVAKHGGRSVSSRAGSADVLEALGVPLDVPAERQAEVLAEAGIAFLFAPVHHPALRACAAARRELAVRTIFNALGPLANPARATHHLLGAYGDTLRPVLARALGKLGVRRAWVVRGEDGMDEVSPFGRTNVTELADGALRERVIRPETFGLRPSRPDAIAGGSAAENADAILSILRGDGHPARDAIVLNAAAALAVFREIDDERAYPELAMEAVRAIDAGAALDKLDSLRAAILKIGAAA
jgi:anthranilate phosphoribosyltransferase